ncbi:lysophospholipid acyltransferase family protein [Tautonia sociabilis]|uniref:1-acyl-sn-glycerol-3-phosphate acyltransferase n=1 Tax=Tautonia sociabilis TaxID=2080755 RepID=A0A432MP19_9BACT|nr:lysophospholipid acyltransferase family protein [Tautonia sociabilis]RUL88818.1 1-acyl-sn-glycerol-3-phosphate acyltransferase [Tautonia sociabilis]
MTPDDCPSPRDRSLPALAFYRTAQGLVRLLFALLGGFRVTGREHVPDRGATLLVSNHLSFWDVFVLGSGISRPLNFVARSSLFKPMLGWLIRSLGGFPIQREGIGVQGFKETLRRLKRGGIVALFPEGTRSPDGALQPLKPGIAPLATRARVPIVPVGIAGTFEAWPRHRRFPRPHPLRLHIGPPIVPEELDSLSPEEAAALIRERIQQAVDAARLGLAPRPPG